MINGTLSRILYLGAFAMVGMCIVGYIVLSMSNDPIPAELNTAMMVAFSLIAGSHITPPNVHKGTEPGQVGREPGSVYTQGGRE